MKIVKISAKKPLLNSDDIIFHMFNNYPHTLLKEVIPVEFDLLKGRYEEIKIKRSKPQDMLGQTVFNFSQP